MINFVNRQLLAAGEEGPTDLRGGRLGVLSPPSFSGSPVSLLVGLMESRRDVRVERVTRQVLPHSFLLGWPPKASFSSKNMDL